MKTSFVTAITLASAVVIPPAGAAELKVIAGASMTASFKDLVPAFERASGHKLEVRFGPTPELIKMATSGPFDLVVCPSEMVQNEAVRAMLAPGPVMTMAHLGFGVAVRAGAAKPDISTPEAFKAAMLKAQSITFLPESSAGAHILKVFERLGIADAMKAKTKAQTSAGAIAPAVANGEAELGLFLANVLIAPGVDAVGPFPGDLQLDFVLVGTVAADTREPDAAKAFLAFLKSPEAATVFKQKGVTPAS